MEVKDVIAASGSIFKLALNWILIAVYLQQHGAQEE